MNSKHIKVMACAAAFCGSVQAELNWNPGEGVTFDETPIVSSEVALNFDSKFLSYGLVDNNEPILTPSASMTFFDLLNVSVSSIFDVTRYGRKAGYRDHSFRYQELDPGLTLTHAFTPEDLSWLPTTVELSAGWMYEQHPRIVDDDTQFVTLSVALPDVWLEPTFSYERDIKRDDGSYLNLEIGHTFSLIEAAEEGAEDVLDLRISAAQGWGDGKRIDAYLETKRPGMMDFTLKGELTWRVTDVVTLSGYAAYTDYLFDSSLRHRARGYEATGDWSDSWNFTAGAALSLAF